MCLVTFILYFLSLERAWLTCSYIVYKSYHLCILYLLYILQSASGGKWRRIYGLQSLTMATECVERAVPCRSDLFGRMRLKTAPFSCRPSPIYNTAALYPTPTGPTCSNASDGRRTFRVDIN